MAGQWQILTKARPITRLVSDPATPDALRKRLETVSRIRRFAQTSLDLPAAKAYGTYADLGREHVVWVVYAAPEFSLKPLSWYYPVVGRLDYRGYFNGDEAERFADSLRRQGNDVYAGGVDAYSTLGWFHDPVLNTFINYPDTDLAETLFHELAHRRLFRKGDTSFNECLATVVAEEGVKRWLRAEGRRTELRQYEARLVRRRQFLTEYRGAHGRLETLYASGAGPVEMRREKARILGRLRAQLTAMFRRWGARGLADWAKVPLNNGNLVSVRLYADRVPEFRKLLESCGGDFHRFFEAAASAPTPADDPPSTASP